MTGNQPGITIPDLYQSRGLCAICSARISRYAYWCRKCTFAVMFRERAWISEQQGPPEDRQKARKR